MNVIVAHRGARDDYQTARALEEAELLEALVTDLYWGEQWEKQPWIRALPVKLLNSLRRRRNTGVPFIKTVNCAWSGLVSLALEKTRLPFSWKRSAIRWADERIGRRAGELARSKKCALLSYSYYAHSAFSHCGNQVPRILFQAHPHPQSVRNILQRELELHPECAGSLSKEWELALPDKDFQRLVDETKMPHHWITASSFTRRTMLENGIDSKLIHVVPYGVRLDQFEPRKQRRSASGPLQLLFVGSINQRKGIRYLIEALQQSTCQNIELRVCGRVVDDLRLFESLGSRVTITPAVSRKELIYAYQDADLFVLPSVAEGFGQVLLEALACGTPILSTTSTAAPDLIVEGEQGFVVPPSRSDVLTSRLQWCLENRARLAGMREQARLRAEHFSWERYRRDLAAVVGKCLNRVKTAEVQLV